MESIVSEVARTAAGLAHIVGVAAQGVVQGAMTVAQGGEFLAGFVAGAIGAAGRLAAGTFGNGNIIMETAIVATAGGIGAELSGGKFVNGAVTAAFAYSAGRIGEYQRQNNSLGSQTSEYPMRADCYRYAVYNCKNQFGFGGRGGGGGGRATPLPRRIGALWPRIDFRGLIQNRSLRSLTNGEINKAFEGTGYSISGHAIKRLRDPRLQGLRFNTLNDVRQIFNRGATYNSGGGTVGKTYRGVSIIMNPQTRNIITIRPE